MEVDVPNNGPFVKLARPAQWLLLIALSLVGTTLLKAASIPAALLLGPMIAGIILESGGAKVRVPRLAYIFAQAVVGCMIARVFTPEIVANFVHRWPLFIGVITAVIVASVLLGFVISKLGILPGTTAVWGLLPGAASVMMLMAEAFGADIRLVAFMQYLRAVFVAISASIIARIWVHVGGQAPPSTIWFPGIHWLPFGETLAIIVFGAWLGRCLRIHAGALLVPMALGAALHLGNVVELQLPPWFLAIGYLFLGWSIGLRFSRPILASAVRAIPQTIVSIVLLMAFCAALAWLLVRELHIDPLTAYLSTSPGGADSVAIIAAASKVDVPFVMALQTVRFILVLLIGPPLSRYAARLLKPAPPGEPRKCRAQHPREG